MMDKKVGSKNPKKTCMVFGTFDRLHKGHEDFFSQARNYGDHLIVVVARDENVRKIKGRDPLKDENQRVSDIRSSGLADEVVLGDLHDFLKPIEQHMPSTICLGYDQADFGLEKKITGKGWNIKIVRLRAYMPDKYKSSILNGRNGQL